MSGGFTTPAYPSADLVAFATALFERAGLDPEEAGTVAEVLVEGDLLGHPTHGHALAAPYLARSRTAAWPARGAPCGRVRS
jgi:L-lactate dehydrogenase